MSSFPQPPFSSSLAERVGARLRELRYRVDWLRFYTLVIIALLAIGMYFVILAYGEWRMNR